MESPIDYETRIAVQKVREQYKRNRGNFHVSMFLASSVSMTAGATLLHRDRPTMKDFLEKHATPKKSKIVQFRPKVQPKKSFWSKLPKPTMIFTKTEMGFMLIGGGFSLAAATIADVLLNAEPAEAATLTDWYETDAGFRVFLDLDEKGKAQAMRLNPRLKAMVIQASRNLDHPGVSVSHQSKKEMSSGTLGSGDSIHPNRTTRAHQPL